MGTLKDFAMISMPSLVSFTPADDSEEIADENETMTSARALSSSMGSTSHSVRVAFSASPKLNRAKGRETCSYKSYENVVLSNSSVAC